MANIDISKFNERCAAFLDSYPLLSPHQKLFNFVFGAFLKMKVDIFFDYSQEGCEIKRDKITFDPVFLLVGAKKRDDVITFLWSLYHEYGHLLQENPNEAERNGNSTEQFSREADAWNKAEHLLSPTQIFQDESRSFFKFRDERLKSYL